MNMHAARWTQNAAIFTATVLVLAACSSPRYRAPVEDRARVAGSAPAQPSEGKPMPGVENAGKPGYATVKAGDTLIKIAIDAGQNWRDIVRWNALDNPDALQVGQVLRVAPPATDSAVAAKPVTAARVEVKPLDVKPASAASAPTTAVSTTPPGSVTPGSTTSGGVAANGAALPSAGGATSATGVGAAQAAGAKPVAIGNDDAVPWGWPAVGSVVTSFGNGRNNGIAIVGQSGDPVIAAADGSVVYGGMLRGYGNVIILKHNASYISAYANNRTLLVKEGQAVKKGQRIAEMGDSDADRVQMHFEIRKDGQAIDPRKLLPPR
jgi:lipoprotein NlpD